MIVLQVDAVSQNARVLSSFVESSERDRTEHAEGIGRLISVVAICLIAIHSKP